MGKKRKKRDILSIQPEKVKGLLNIPFMDIGSENDPCFGKLYDPTTKECNQCGDSEFCAIVIGQLNHQKRAQLEISQPFKDKEESEIPMKPWKEVRKLIRAKARELVKFNKSTGITKDYLQTLLYNEFFYWNITPEKVIRVIDKLVEDNKLLIKKDKYYPCKTN